MTHFLGEKLDGRKIKKNDRHLTVKEGLVDFASNDYLGFSRSLQWRETEKLGSTGSRLLTGNSCEIEELECLIAAFHGAKAGLIFNSGYAANQGVLSSVAMKGDTIIFDAHCHASTWDGMRLSQGRLVAFRHQDLAHLEKKLKSAQGRVFVCTESTFSCDGSLTPLQEIADLCSEYGAHLIIDEAHATGVYGEDGRGLCYSLNKENRFFARIHTFSKALGAHGAIVLGSPLLREYLINFCRTFIYTTALPFPIVSKIREAYLKLGDAENERKKLRELINYFNTKAHSSGHKFLHSETPIQCLMIAGNQEAKWHSHFLEKKGFDVRALLSPTVPRRQERLRICLHAYNSKEEIDELFKCLSEGDLHE